MEYSLDGIVALINRKEPLPSGFAKALKQVKGITDNRGLHKLCFHELCEALCLKLTEEHYESKSTYISCDYLYKIMSVLLRHNICIVPLGVARNLSIYSTIYLIPRADLMNDSDIYGLQQVAARKKSSHTNNEIEIIIRAKKKIQNYNTLLHVFECLGSAQRAPLDTNQRTVLNAIINDMLLPRDAIRYIKSLFSYACEFGSFQYDFTNPKYVNTVNAAWGQEQALEVMNIIAKTIAPSHLAINIPQDFPHAQLLQERYDFYCPDIYFESSEPVVQNVVPVSERALGSLNYSQRRSRLKAQVSFALESLERNPADKVIDELKVSKAELLQRRPGFSSALIERLSFLPPEYGNMTDYFASLQEQLLKDELSRLAVPDFAHSRLALYVYNSQDNLSVASVAHNNKRYFLESKGFSKLLGNQRKSEDTEPLNLESFANEERYRYAQNTKHSVESTIELMSSKDLKEPNSAPVVAKHNLAQVLNNHDLDPNYQETEEGDDDIIDPKDFAPTLKKMRGRKDKEVHAFESLGGAARDDLFHVVPYTFDKFNFLLHDYLIWGEHEHQVVNNLDKVTLSLQDDYSKNLRQFIYKPFKQMGRLNKVMAYEFLLRYLFAAPHASCALDEQGNSDESEIERFFEQIVYNNYLLLHGCELSLGFYHSLYYFDRYLQEPATHFNNELFYLFLFKKEPYLINLYLARLVDHYGSNLAAIPREFYSLLALNMLLFPQKSHVAKVNTIVQSLLANNSPSHNFYKVLLTNKLADELYHEVHDNQLNELSLLFMDHEQSHKQSLVYEESFYYEDCKRKLLSALSSNYFESLCSLKTFDALMSKLAIALSGANLKTSWQIQEQELQAIALKYAYDSKLKNPTFSVQYLSHELQVLLTTINKVAALVMDFGSDIEIVSDEIECAPLSDQEIKEQVAALDLNSPKLLEASRHLKQNQVAEQFTNESQERADIYQDYAQRFGSASGTWEQLPPGYELKVKHKLTPSSLINSQDITANTLQLSQHKQSVVSGDSTLLYSMLSDASEELVQDIRMLQELLSVSQQHLKEYLDNKNLTLSDLDDKITKVNFSFLVYAYHKMIDMVSSNLQSLQEQQSEHFYQEQVLNSYFKLACQDKFGKGTSFYDEFSNNLYKGYIVPVLNKLLCSEHQYCYSFSQNIPLWERMSSIFEQFDAWYNQDYALSDIAYNRFMVECVLYAYDKSFVHTKRDYVLGVTHTSQLGFASGIATDYLQEVSDILHNSLQVQIAPYYLPLKGGAGANFSLLRPSVNYISVLPIPKRLLTQELRSTYNDLLFSLHCANSVMEILNVLLPVDLRQTPIVALLVNEVLIIHDLKQDDEVVSFISEFVRSCLRTISLEPPVERNKLLDSKFTLLKAMMGTYSTQRLKQMLFLSFGLALNTMPIGIEVKKNLIKVLKNLDLLSRAHKDYLVKVKNDKVTNNRTQSWKAPNAKQDSQSNPSLARYSWYRPNNSLKDQPLNLDLAKIKAKIEESEKVQEVITQLRDSEQELNSSDVANNNNNNNTAVAPTTTTPSLDPISTKEDNSASHEPTVEVGTTTVNEGAEFLNDKLRQVVESLAIQNSDAIVYSEFNGICVSHGLLSGNYCIEALNEYSFEAYDEPLLELDGEVVYITTDILELIYAQCVALKQS